MSNRVWKTNVERLYSWNRILKDEASLEIRGNDEQCEISSRTLHNFTQIVDAVIADIVEFKKELSHVTERVVTDDEFTL